MVARNQINTIAIPEDYEPGPAMQALTEKQQVFVFAMLQIGGINNTRAAIMAGYAQDPENPNQIEVTAYRLAHSPKIQEAIREEAQRRMNSAAIMATNTLLEIANDVACEKKDRLKALEMILNRSGLHAKTEHKVDVTHTHKNSKEMVARITMLAQRIGVDPQKLLGGAKIVDATYQEILPPQKNPEADEDDLSDIL